jgi:hypothetical protein
VREAEALSATPTRCRVGRISFSATLPAQAQAGSRVKFGTRSLRQGPISSTSMIARSALSPSSPALSARSKRLRGLTAQHGRANCCPCRDALRSTLLRTMYCVVCDLARTRAGRLVRTSLPPVQTKSGPPLRRGRSRAFGAALRLIGSL